MTVRLLALLSLLAVATAAAASGVRSPGERARQTVIAIAALGPRPAGSRGERRADRLVAAWFRALGYRVSIQSFPIPHGLVSHNVVARTPGRLRGIIVAHLDGGPNTVAADDNASGVAALLEVARGRAHERGLLFAAVGAEERFQTDASVHLGSLNLANRLPRADRRSIPVAVSLDMVGHGPTLNVRGYEASPNRSSRLTLAAARALGLSASYMVGTGSDHVELTRAGIPTAWIEWRPDACYDQPCDTTNRIYAAKLEAAIKLTARVLG